MTKISPTQRTLAYERERGADPRVVERWRGRVRVDLWGADIISQKPGEPPKLIQTTTSSHFAERVKKVQEEPGAWVWIRNGGKFEVHGWKPKEKKPRVWTYTTDSKLESGIAPSV